MSSEKPLNKYTDSHTLYVTSGAATNEDLKASFLNALKRTGKNLNKRFNCKFEVNLIYNREGVPYGFGYLYISNPAVYHMMLGRNPDGMERVRIRDTFEDFSSIDLLNDDLPLLDWSEESKKICLESLDPLMELEPVILTPSQRQTVKLLKSCPEKVAEGYFLLGPAIVKEVRSNCIPNVLCSKNIPGWLTESQVFDRFRLYSTRPGYPKIKIHHKRNKSFVFVEFDPATRDAQFALLMTTKTTFKSFGPGKPEVRTLIFTHAFKSSKTKK